jgi:hypothetical protein
MALDHSLRAAIADVSVPFTPPSTADLRDDALFAAQRELAEIRRRVDAAAAAFTAEITHRSRPELGYEGLAQRHGARTPQHLVQTLTGASGREANTLVKIGAIMSTASSPRPDVEDRTPWLRPVGSAVAEGNLSLDAADAIRAGLGEPAGEITAGHLEAAAVELVATASTMTVERLGARARDLRAELDLDGVRDAEQQLRDQRRLTLRRLPNGLLRMIADLDPESGALAVAVYDAATSPRRGGPRFVDATQNDRASKLIEDERTTEQIALDAFVELIRVASLADNHVLLGSVRPAVQLIVTAADLRERRGVGRIEGQSVPVSIQTIERHICDVGVVPILFDSFGRSIDVGRTQRLFTARQRLALAARDGGCRFPECERPPSWTEAHHIREWSRHGPTDLSNGVLLCRHHHLLVHNNGWQITYRDGEMHFVPPASLDPGRVPIPAPSKSRALSRAMAQV